MNTEQNKNPEKRDGEGFSQSSTHPFIPSVSPHSSNNPTIPDSFPNPTIPNSFPTIPASQTNIINIVTRVIVETVHPLKVIIFGSYARGEQNRDSDLDFLVIAESDKPRTKRALEIRKKLRGLKFPVDIIVYTPAETKKWESVSQSFVHTVFREGITVYG